MSLSVDFLVAFTPQQLASAPSPMRRLPGGEEERWRTAGDEPAAEEVVFADARTERATGLRRVVVPWSETVRYGQKKQGYQGGASP